MGGLLKQYFWIANLLIILFCTYFVAKIINVYVAKAIEVHQTIGVMKKAEKAAAVREFHDRTYYDVIVERNMFDSSESAPAEGGETQESGEVAYEPGQDAVETSLPVKVFAVLVVGEGKDERSSATLSMGKDIDVYGVKGDKSFSPGVTLVQVKPDRIEFVNRGRLEFKKIEDDSVGSIFGPPTEGTPQVASKEEVVKPKEPSETVAKEGDKFVIDQREIDNALTNLDRLYTEIRAVPNFQDGKVTGMKILNVKPGSLFAKLGLKRGDILSRINGIELDVKRGFDIFNQLKEQKNFNLDLVRGGATQTFDYEIR